jgi:hypothetical protein
MDCHGLPRDSGSWAGVSHTYRVCRFCGAGSMGDENLFVFECPHLQPIRDNHGTVFFGKMSLWVSQMLSAKAWM